MTKDSMEYLMSIREGEQRGAQNQRAMIAQREEAQEAKFAAELEEAGFGSMGHQSFDTYCRERRRGRTPEQARQIMLQA